MPRVSCAVAAAQKGVPVTSLCQNGGQCVDVDNQHMCECATGYDGSYCEQNVNECASSPCKNGATCQDRLGYYHCVCRDGYQGLECQYDVDECSADPCQNGG